MGKDGFSRWYGSDNEVHCRRYLKEQKNKNIEKRYQLFGEWGYHFNANGFWGEESRPDAGRRIMVIGFWSRGEVGTGMVISFADVNTGGEMATGTDLMNLSQGGLLMIIFAER